MKTASKFIGLGVMLGCFVLLSVASVKIILDTGWPANGSQFVYQVEYISIPGEPWTVLGSVTSAPNSSLVEFPVNLTNHIALMRVRTMARIDLP